MYRFWMVLVIGMVFFSCKEDKPVAKVEVDKSSASDLISQEIANDPQNAELYYKRAITLYESGKYAQASQDLKAAISLDGSKYQYYHLLADSYLDGLQSKDALDIMKNVVEIFPENIPSLLKYSEYQLILKQNENSVLTLNEVLRMDPESAEAYFMLGLNFMEMEDMRRAISSLQTAVEMDPELLDAWLALAQIHEDTDADKAITYYDNAIMVSPDTPRPYHAKAFYLQNIDRIDEALELYRKINIGNPNYVPSYLNSGILFMELDSIDRAYESFNIMTGIEPQNPMGYYYKAQVELLRGDQEAALRELTTSLNLDPDYQDANELYKEVSQYIEEN